MQNYRQNFVNRAANFLYWNFWTLNRESRKDLFYAIREYVLDELFVSVVSLVLFYNTFDEWFIRQIRAAETFDACELPIDHQMCRTNQRRY